MLGALYSPHLCSLPCAFLIPRSLPSAHLTLSTPQNWATADFSLISSLDSTAAMTRTVGIVCGDYGVSYTKNAGCVLRPIAARSLCCHFTLPTLRRQTFNVTADSANLSGCQSGALCCHPFGPWLFSFVCVCVCV